MSLSLSTEQWIDWVTEELTEVDGDSGKKKLVLKIFDLALEEGYCKTALVGIGLHIFVVP